MLCFYGLLPHLGFRMTIRSVNLAYQSMTGCRNKLGACALTFGLATLAVLPLLGQPNVITTVAGGGCHIPFDYGDGGPATSAVLNRTFGACGGPRREHLHRGPGTNASAR
jgi:hypothetical protein